MKSEELKATCPSPWDGYFILFILCGAWMLRVWTEGVRFEGLVRAAVRVECRSPGTPKSFTPQLG